MKNITILIFLLQSGSLVYGQTTNFDERINAIDLYAGELQALKSEINLTKTEIESFKNSKILAKDQKILDSLNIEIKKISNEITLSSEYVEAERVKKEVKELKNLVQEKDLYLSTQEKLKTLSNNEANSSRLNQYIQSVKEGKDNKSKIIFFALTQTDKDIAKEFDQANTYLIRERYMQDPLDQQIKEQKKKIESSLFYPEDAIKNIKQSLNDLKVQKGIFQNLKHELSTTQYDFKFETWSLGLFNCESNAHYFTPTNFKNLIMLKNEDSLMSVIKIDPSSPNSFQIVYHCKKPGRFGGCLDNTKKELCRLDEACQKSLIEMEASYNRNDFFQAVKPYLASGLLAERLKDYQDVEKFNVLKAMNDSKKLGYYKLEELYSMMDPIIEMSKSLEAKTPEDYLKKIKIEIDKAKKKAIDQVMKKSGPGTSPQKMEQSKNSLNYLYTSMQTELEDILNDDVIQNRAYKNCENSEIDREKFCQASNQWRTRVNVFEPKTEITNLTPTECPRGVFRFQPENGGSQKNDCSLDSLGELEKSIKDVEQKLGN